MAQEQLDMLDDTRVPDEPTTGTARPEDEPTNKQVVNAIVWAINKLSAEIIRFSGLMETRADRIEERLGHIEKSLALIHEERGRAARSADKEKTK